MNGGKNLSVVNGEIVLKRGHVTCKMMKKSAMLRVHYRRHDCWLRGTGTGLYLDPAQIARQQRWRSDVRVVVFVYVYAPFISPE